MDKTDFGSVGEYIATHPKDVRVILRRVRTAIRKALPGAEEVIRYQMPGYRVRGRTVLQFAGWKKHYSLYPASARLAAAFKDDVGACEIDKATIRFPFTKPVPVRLIARIAKFRAKEAAERAAMRRPISNKR